MHSLTPSQPQNEGGRRAKPAMQLDASQVASDVHATSREIAARIGRRLRTRFHGAIAFMVATSWMVLFDDAFALLTGGAEGLWVKFAHALAFTILAAILAALFDDDDEANPGAGAVP